MGKNDAVAKPTPVGEWKGRLKVNGTPLELPSGNTALVKQVSPAAFLQSGMIPDPIRPIIFKAINEKKGLPPKTAQKMIDDPKLLSSAMELMDKTLCNVVIEPEIMMPPKCKQCGEYAVTPQHDKEQPTYSHSYQEGERDESILYADEVDMMDKQFIFQWVMGGTKQIESFREELAESVGSVSAGEDVQDEAK